MPLAAEIQPKDYMTHGYTGGCKGCEYCEYLATGIGSRKNHSVECRLRREELLAVNEEGQQRLREVVERKEHWLAEQVENKDKKTLLTKTNVPADTEGAM